MGKKIIFIFIFVFLISLVSSELPLLQNGNQGLPNLANAVTSNNTYNVNTTIQQTINNNIVNNFDQSLNTTDDVQFNDLTLTGNLTLGQKITFAFAEMIDNIVDGWIRVTGNLNVTENLMVNGNTNITGNLTVDDRIIQKNYSIYPVIVNDNVIDSAFCVEMKSPSGQKQCKLLIQPGGIGQASVIRRSLGIVNDDICLGKNESNMQCYADEGGFEWNIDFNTSTSGADIGIADDLEVIGEIWLRNSAGQPKFLTRILDLDDELHENIVFNDANLSIVNGVLNINDTLNETLVVNINRSETITDSISDSISLNTGTDLNPSINHITYQNPDSPTLTIDTSEPSIPHSEVSIIYVGGSMSNIYLFENTISHNEKFIDQVYDTFGDMGGIYLDGLNTLVNSTTMNISTGNVRLRLNKISYTNNLNSVSDGFFYIDNSGDFIECIDNTCLNNYLDDSSISNNRYFSIVWGVVPVGNKQRLMIILQGNPGSGREYRSAIDAEEDTLSKVNFFPSNTDFKLTFIPVARTIHRRTGNNDFIEFPTNGELFQDLRGKATVSSGGVPSPPITDHNLLNPDSLEWNNSQHTFDNSGKFFNIGSYNLTTIGNLTIGEKLTFSFGEFIDNIVDGWMRITGSLNVTGNITADWVNVSNDVCIDGGNCLSSAGGGGATSGNRVLITTAIASNDAFIDFTSSIDDTYDEYVVEMIDVIPATDNVVLWARAYVLGVLKVGANDYDFATGTITTATFITNRDTGETRMELIEDGAGNNAGSASGESLNGNIHFYSPSNSSLKTIFKWDVTYINTNILKSDGGGSVRANSAVNGFRLLFSSGNIASGTFKLYGVEK